MRRFVERRTVLLLTAALVATCPSGCGGAAGPTLADVAGSVQVDGQPLAKGVIVFDPADGAGGSATGAVENGRFRLRCPPGLKKVAITAFRETEKKDEYGGPVLESTIPPRYNTKSTLTADVPPSGADDLKFDLSTTR